MSREQTDGLSLPRSRPSEPTSEGSYQPFLVKNIEAPADPARTSIDPDRLGELADSIAAEGLHQPVGVVLCNDGVRAELAWGHRRLLAVRLLRRDWIDAKVFQHGTDLQLARWSENGQRADLDPLEEAGEVRRFLAAGHPFAYIARMFRRSPAWVKDRLALLDLPDDLRECISNGTLNLAVVSVLRDVDNALYRESLIREAVTHGASAAVAEVWRAHYLADRVRIISNTVTIEQLAEERKTFKLLVPCDWCGVDAPVEVTRTWRLCEGCHVEVTAARKDGIRQTS